MKKFFLNKKLMTFILSLCLIMIISGIGVFAAVKNNMFDLNVIKNFISRSEGNNTTEDNESLADDEEPEIIIEKEENVIQIEEQNQEVVEVPVEYAAPDRMMAITLSAGNEFFTESKTSVSDIQNDIDNSIKSAIGFSANTIFLETSLDENTVLYKSEDKNQVTASIDMLKYAIDNARKNDLYVYIVFDVLGNDINIVDNEKINSIKKNIEAVCEYDIDGIMLNDYTLSSGKESYKGYICNGNGTEYEKYLTENTESAVRTAYNAVKAVDPSIAVGIAVEPVWANNSSDENGSNTKSDYETLYDGFADSKKFIEDGLADFVTVKCDYSIGNKDISFNEYLGWWDSLVSDDIPLYIFQYAAKACSKEKGWGDPSELSDQVISAEKLSGFCGSIFDSLTALESNPKQSTDALIKYLTENVDPSFLLTQLEMTKPAKTTFSTYEATVTFAGASDINFDLMLNNEKVKRDANGAFMLTIDLEPGLNTFTFSHKEKTITYNITRNVKVLKEISPLGNVTAGGGMSITVTALAYENSTVTATLGSSTVTLKVDGTVDDTTDNESTYKNYSGTLTLPSATSSEQKIGNIVVKGTWKGVSESMEGAFVTVLPKPTTGGLVEVIADAAETFPIDTLNDLSDYDCYPLAKGTRDYIVGDEIVYKEGENTFTYYILDSGQRVYTKDVKAVSGELGGNIIHEVSVEANERYTYVSFDMDQPVAYVAKYSSSAFTIDFKYTDGVPDDMNLKCTPLFDSLDWNKSKATLSLSTSSGFLGYTAYYKGGKLIFRFNNPTGTSSLSGVPIVVDVGHSALGVGALGYLSAYGEYEINLAVCKYLKSELQDRGAAVYMMDTVKSRPSLQDRVDYACSKDPLVFVSVHCNSSTSNTGHGSECFYFTRFSSKLASVFADRVSSALETSNRGGMLGRYYVTRIQNYPSVLGEIGFVSNESDYYKMIQNSYQRDIADAIADSIQSYLGSVGKNGNYSYGKQTSSGEYISESTSSMSSSAADSSSNIDSSGNEENSENSSSNEEMQENENSEANSNSEENTNMEEILLK